MKFIGLIKISLKNLLTQKRRSFLTMLGIIIGIFSVVLVMSVGAGAQSLIIDQVKQRGTDQIAILPGASDENGPPAQALGIIITTLTYEDGQALLNKSNVSHIKTLAAYTSGNDTLQWQNQEQQVTYTGTTASYREVEKITMAKGRFFDEAEELSGENVMVLGAKVAEDIFGNQDPIGEQVKLKKVRFRVVGVMEEKGSSAFEDSDNSVVIPLLVSQRQLLGIRHVSFIRLVVDDEDNIKQTIEEIRQVLIDRHDEEDFSIRNIADALKILENITNALKFFLVAIAGIALFVGGVGIMNIMLIAVKEKTREIGLRKSVGARDGDILSQFLIETIVLTVTGVIIGLIIGIIFAYGISVVVNSLGYTYAFIISPWAIFTSFLLALIIGFLFGIVPARKAAKLDPIDALRYE